MGVAYRLASPLGSWPMTPAAAIAALDSALAASGQDVTLRRTTGTQQVPFDVDCRAMVRKYQPDELIGGITQGGSMVVLSPTEITAAQWPGAQPQGAQDARVPKKGDKLRVAGLFREVEHCEPIYLAGELVRLNLWVKG
jgi:hypothetical protein